MTLIKPQRIKTPQTHVNPLKPKQREREREREMGRIDEE
jgi:hypothetical protein